MISSGSARIIIAPNNNNVFRALARQHSTWTKVDGRQNPIDVSDVAVSMNGIELQDRELYAAISEGREPSSSVARVLECYRALDQIEQQL